MRIIIGSKTTELDKLQKEEIIPLKDKLKPDTQLNKKLDSSEKEVIGEKKITYYVITLIMRKMSLFRRKI